MSGQDVHRQAEVLLRKHLDPHGIGLERLPDLPVGYALLLPGGRMKVAKVLVRPGPHRRGRQGALGMHWMLHSDPAAPLRAGFEDYVALVDVARQAVWLMPSPEFRSRASAVAGGRWHLDWLVARAGRSRIADEAEFDDYRLERWLEDGNWRLEPQSQRAA